MREHNRTKYRFRSEIGFRAASCKPGEQIAVRRFKRVPEFFDLRNITAKGFGKRGLSKARGYTDPWCAAEQLEQRPSLRCVETVE